MAQSMVGRAQLAQGDSVLATQHGLARGALCGFSAFVITVLALHLVQPDLRPTTVAVSYYVHGAHGWWLTAGLLSLGLGSLALAAAMERAFRGQGGGLARWGVALWGACVVVGGVFPADPPGRWSEPPSLAGMIHGGVALVGFAALPVAALGFAWSCRRHSAWREYAHRLIPLSAGTALALGAFGLSLWPALATNGPPMLLGLTERVLLAVYVAWLAAVAAFAAGRGRDDNPQGGTHGC